MRGDASCSPSRSSTRQQNHVAAIVIRSTAILTFDDPRFAICGRVLRAPPNQRGVAPNVNCVQCIAEAARAAGASETVRVVGARPFHTIDCVCGERINRRRPETRRDGAACNDTSSSDHSLIKGNVSCVRVNVQELRATLVGLHNHCARSVRQRDHVVLAYGVSARRSSRNTTARAISVSASRGTVAGCGRCAVQHHIITGIRVAQVSHCRARRSISRDRRTCGFATGRSSGRIFHSEPGHASQARPASGNGVIRAASRTVVGIVVASSHVRCSAARICHSIIGCAQARHRASEPHRICAAVGDCTSECDGVGRGAAQDHISIKHGIASREGAVASIRARSCTRSRGSCTARRFVGGLAHVVVDIGSGKVIESAVSVGVAIVPTVGPRATNARAISHVRGHATVNSMQRRDSRVADVNVTEALDD